MQRYGFFQNKQVFVTKNKVCDTKNFVNYANFPYLCTDFHIKQCIVSKYSLNNFNA